jgi:hypothetical protein
MHQVIAKSQVCRFLRIFHQILSYPSAIIAESALGWQLGAFSVQVE